LKRLEGTLVALPSIYVVVIGGLSHADMVKA